MGLLKNLLIAGGVCEPKKLPVPVISVGNLTFGGTGKTPVVHFLLEHLIHQGFRPGLVSRSYRAQAKLPEKIDLASNKKAAHYGDEPYWLACEFPEVPVYVGAVKLDVARVLCKNEDNRINVICVDDGFQHRQLARNLDIVILDSTQDLSTYRFPPWGRAREGFNALARCQAIFLTKVNLASEQKLSNLRKLLPKQTPVFEFDYKVQSIVNLHSGISKPLSEIKGNILPFCGLAMPESFFMNFKELSGVKICEQIIFRDHYAYQPEDVKKLCQKGRDLSVDYFITSEKDAIKLGPIWPSADNLWSTKLELSMKQPLESLYGLYSRYLS